MLESQEFTPRQNTLINIIPQRVKDVAVLHSQVNVPFLQYRRLSAIRITVIIHHKLGCMDQQTVRLR